MSTSVSYEVLTLRRGKWLVERVTDDKEEAKETALETLGTGHYEAVKVIGERLNEDTGESTSFTVLNKVDQRKAGSPPPKGEERRKKVDRRKATDRRKKPDRRKTKKSGAGWAVYAFMLFLFLWAMLGSVAFLICTMSK